MESSGVGKCVFISHAFIIPPGNQSGSQGQIAQEEIKNVGLCKNHPRPLIDCI